MAKSKTSVRQKQSRSGASLLEWISGVVGALLAIGVLSYLAADVLDETAEGPPVLYVSTQSVHLTGTTFTASVKVRNRSGRTAASVGLEGTLNAGGEVVETSSATLDYVPAHSEREAGLIFDRDPRSYRLKVRATGYQEP